MKPSHYKPAKVLPDNGRSNSWVLSPDAFRAATEPGGRHFYGKPTL